MDTVMNAKLLCMSCMRIKKAEGTCPFCGFDESAYTPAPHHLSPRTILGGKYLVGRVLGEGGFGITYLGWDLNLELKIAVKEFYPTGFVTRENTTTNTVTPYVGEKEQFFRNGRERFVDEAKSLARFYTLPGIVSVKDFFQENGTAYIVMEFVEGETLKQRLGKAGGRMPAAQVLEMMKPLMRSLSEIHKAAIIHRDISPDNIMVTPEGNVKLLDFGSARGFTDSGNRSLSVLLKPGYAPEEQYRSRGVQGPWTDVYALCATIYRAITGLVPDEAIERVRNDAVKSPSQLGVAMEPSQESALMKGLAVLQKDRFQSVEELCEKLYAQYPKAPQAAPKPSKPPKPMQKAARPAPAPVQADQRDKGGNQTKTGATSKWFSKKMVIIYAIAAALVVFILGGYRALVEMGNNILRGPSGKISDTARAIKNIPTSKSSPGHVEFEIKGEKHVLYAAQPMCITNNPNNNQNQWEAAFELPAPSGQKDSDNEFLCLYFPCDISAGSVFTQDKYLMEYHYFKDTFYYFFPESSSKFTRNYSSTCVMTIDAWSLTGGVCRGHFNAKLREGVTETDFGGTFEIQIDQDATSTQTSTASSLPSSPILSTESATETAACTAAPTPSAAPGSTPSQPTPAPTPAPARTPAPTPAPTPEPTREPTPEPITPSPSPSPAPSPTDGRFMNDAGAYWCSTHGGDMVFSLWFCANPIFYVTFDCGPSSVNGISYDGTAPCTIKVTGDDTFSSSVAVQFNISDSKAVNTMTIRGYDGTTLIGSYSYRYP